MPVSGFLTQVQQSAVSGPPRRRERPPGQRRSIPAAATPTAGAELAAALTRTSSTPPEGVGEAAIGFDSRASDLVGFEALESLSCATRGRHQRDRAIVRFAAVVVRFTVEPTVFAVARGRVLDIATRGLTPVRLSVVCLA